MRNKHTPASLLPTADAVAALDTGTRAVSPESDLEQARLVLREVGTLARAASGISRDPVLVEEEFGELRTRIRVLQLLVERVGYVAEMGLRRLGDGAMPYQPL